MKTALTTKDIRRLLGALNDELRADDVKAHVKLAGGAVMCLVFAARDATRDVDAWFQPSVKVLEAAHRVAARENVPDTWLNDAVTGFLSDRGTFDSFLELDHLRVFVADARYMLAMKTLALRTGEGYHDEDDLRYLVRHLDLTRFEDAEAILSAYYSLEGYPRRSLAALREIIER